MISVLQAARASSASAGISAVSLDLQGPFSPTCGYHQHSGDREVLKRSRIEKRQKLQHRFHAGKVRQRIVCPV